MLKIDQIKANHPGSLAIGPFGSRMKSDLYTTSGVPVIRGQNITDSRQLLGDFVYISDQTADGLSACLVYPDDLVFPHRGSIGEVAIVPHNEADRYMMSTSLMKLTCNASIVDPLFIFYYFRSQHGRDELLKRASTVGTPGIGQPLTSLRSIEVPIPPLREQGAIASLLGALDDKIALNERVSESALELAIALYRFATERGPKRSVALISAAKWQSGGTPATSEPSYWNGDIPWISALSLKSPWIDDSDRKVTKLGVSNGTRLVPCDTVIFVVRGSSLDTEFRVGLTQREVAFGQDCKALRALPGIDPAMLFIAIKSSSEEILRLVDHAGHGAGRLSTDLIEKYQVQLPTGAGSQPIAVQVRSLIKTGSQRQAENRCLRQLRDTILPKLISGQVRLRDAARLLEGAI